MGEWWHGIWNDPVSGNPWAFGALIVCVAVLTAAMHGLTRLEQMFRRRRQGTTMEATDPTPVSYDTDRQTAEQAIDAAHVEARSVHDSVTDLRIDTQEDDTPAEWRQGLPDHEPRTQPGHGLNDDTVIQEAPAVERPRMAASATVPQAMIQIGREMCVHCDGRGYVPGINDLLQESIALLGDAGDSMIRSFYGLLFRSAPELVSLFPGNPVQGDLGTDHKGAAQREKLLAALVALSNLYDPADADKMAHLDSALATFGRSHAAFVRPDGTIKGATWEEYAAVKDALFATLVRAAGNAWRAEYTAAWSQAYDYAAAVMLVEQYRSGFSAPRFPRG